VAERGVLSVTIKQLIYVSAAARDLQDAELGNILDSARRNNAQNAVTGILLNIDGGFLQVLEGDANHVDETFKRIELDRRHIAVRKLYETQTSTRAFAGWSMGFTDLRNKDLLIKGAFPISRAALSAALPPGLGAELLIFIRTFCAINAAAE
jgi:hypothetical protein